MRLIRHGVKLIKAASPYRFINHTRVITRESALTVFIALGTINRGSTVLVVSVLSSFRIYNYND